MSRLIGVGSSGVLDQIGVHIRNSSNIIIRNLWIRNVKKSGSPLSNGGDAIGMESTVNNIWVDHNTLEASGGESDGYDSLLDMKAGVTNVTVSYNHYRNSSRAGLIGSSDSDAPTPTSRSTTTGTRTSSSARRCCATDWRTATTTTSRISATAT